MPKISDLSEVTSLVNTDEFLVLDGDQNRRIAAGNALALTGADYQTRTAAIAAEISTNVDAIRTRGYATAGDGGGAVYKRIATPAPVEAWHFQSADGSYWELVADGRINVKALGATGDGVTNDTTACQNAWDFLDANGGGVLYFPRGTFLINIVGRGDDGVSLQGDGPSSILCSFATNDWAVKYDNGFPSGRLFVRDLTFKDASDSEDKHGLYVNTGTGFKIENVTFSGLGIGSLTNGTWGFSWDHCRWDTNYVDHFITASDSPNTSITNINGQTVTITNMFFAQQPSLQVFTRCTFRGKISVYIEQPDNPFQLDDHYTFISCLFNPINGLGLHIRGGANQWVYHTKLINCWFEGSGIQTRSLRGYTLPASYIYSSGPSIFVDGGAIGSMEVSNDAVGFLSNVTLTDNSVLTSADRAKFIGENITADKLAGFFCPFYVRNARTKPGSSARGIIFHTQPKTNIVRGCYDHSLIYSNKCSNVDALFSAFGGTVTRAAVDSVFGFNECFQIQAIQNNGAYLFPSSETLTAGKVHVMTIAMKSAGSAFNVDVFGGLATANFEIPADRFQTFAIMHCRTDGPSERPILRNQDASTQTWYVSGIQYHSFDSWSEAHSFIESGDFAVSSSDELVQSARLIDIDAGSTVGNLPTPTVGMIARVTDASAPSVGSTVAGSGAAAALVWYNGSNWTVIGI